MIAAIDLSNVDANNILQLLTAIVVVYGVRETKRVHGVVNSRASAQDKRIEQLTKSLNASDTPVPDSATLVADEKLVEKVVTDVTGSAAK